MGTGDGLEGFHWWGGCAGNLAFGEKLCQCLILLLGFGKKISCNFFVMDRPLIVGVDNVDGPSGHLFSRGVGVIDDKLLLRSMMEIDSQPGMGGNLTDRLSAILARKVDTLNIQNGAAIVYPLSAVVARTLRKKQETKDDDGTLFVLYKELFEAGDDVRRLIFGVALGDRGLHFAAGFVESRHVRTTMSDDIFLDYSRKMSCTGYQAALGAADRLPGSMSRSVKQNVSSVLERFDDAREVMAAIRRAGAAA